MKILVFGMTENPGGVESFLMNYYRNINKDKIQFDFLCNSYDNIAYEDELISCGSKTIHFPARSKNYISYRGELNKFFKAHANRYDAIWVNVCSLANIDYLRMAKRYGVRRRIIHSHNSQNMDGFLRGELHKHNKKHIVEYATDFWACSEGAAGWFYSGLPIKIRIIYNAIDTDKVQYDRTKRNNVRSMLGWEENFIIGNVGRLHFQKNQLFILDIFVSILKKAPAARLVLVGQGEEEEKIKDRIKSLGLKEKVHLAGIQYDIVAWLSAFDLFLFPSVFEGLSIAALEAQANGLPVLASEGVIPEEVKINDNFIFFDLKQSAKEWGEKVIEMIDGCKRLNKDTIRSNFLLKGYEIEDAAGKLTALFLGEG